MLEGLKGDEKRKKLAELVRDAEMEAEAQRAGLGPAADLTWHDLRDFYEGPGQHWTKVAPQLARHLQPDWSVTNHTKSACKAFAAQVVAALPVWHVVEHRTGEPDDAADRTTTYLRAWAQVHNLRGEELLAVLNALVVGRGVLYPYWDKRREDVVVRSLPPENLYPDPTATRLEDCSFIAIRHLYGVELAKRLWPKLDLTQVETTYGEEDEFEPQVKGAECVLVWEVYYDFGERLMIYSGEQTLFDGESPVPESPYKPHRYPLVFFDFEPRENSFWPLGLVQELMDPQNRVNKGHTRINTWERYFVAPTWTTESQLTKSSFDMTPGTINWVEPESNTRPNYAPPLPREAVELTQMAKQELDGLAGTVEVTQGLRPTGVNTGIALQVLHEAARQRMTAPAAAWTAAKAHLGQLVLELMQKFYTEERVLAIVEAGEAQLVGVTPDDLTATVPTEEWDEEAQAPVMKTENRRYMVVTQAGGEIPLSMAARAELAVQLAQIPSSLVRPSVIDDEALLDAVQFPGRDRVLERKAQLVEQQQQAQQQAMEMQQAQERAMTATQQMANIGARLQEMMPTEMFDLFQGILAGTVTDEQLVREFWQAVQELGPDVASLVQQYIALDEIVAREGSQNGQPAGGTL